MSYRPVQATNSLGLGSLLFSGRLKTELLYYTRNRSRHNLYTNCVKHKSSSQLLLYQPATRINFQSKAFSITPPAAWNSLSSIMKSFVNITTFKAHLCKLNCSLLHKTRSNISSAAGASAIRTVDIVLRHRLMFLFSTLNGIAL